MPVVYIYKRLSLTFVECILYARHLMSFGEIAKAGAHPLECICPPLDAWLSSHFLCGHPAKREEGPGSGMFRVGCGLRVGVEGDRV